MSITQLRAVEPITVAVVDDAELVVAGVATMLEPYPQRVRIVRASERMSTPLDVLLWGDDSRGKAAGTPCHAQVPFTWRSETRPGELSKTLSAADLVDALERIADPRRPWPDDDGSWVGQDLGLSERESQVLGLIASGLTNEQVATRSYLSINTIKSYIRTCYRKIGVTTRSQAVLWAVDHGLGERRQPIARSGSATPTG